MHKAKKNKLTPIKPEAMTATRPGGKARPAEDGSQQAVVKPENVSPYDLPPPGPGIFPQIFTDLN